MGRRFYFTNEEGENIADDYVGNIRGARTYAQSISDQRQEEIVINDCQTDDMIDFICPESKR